MIKRYSTKNKLSTKQSNALLSKLIYSVEGISNCDYDEEMEEICIETTVDSDLQLIDITVEKLIGQQKKIRPFAVQVLHEQDDYSLQVKDLNEGAIHDIFNVKRKKDVSVMLSEAIDQWISRYAKSLQAVIRSYPSMIEKGVLEACHYIKSFPQNLYAVSEFPHNNSVLEQVQEDDDYQKYLRVSDKLLSPAICFHCYDELKNQKLVEPVLLTSAGNCFRHETSWRVGKHRLSEFKMREIVFVGTSEYVESMRKQIMNTVWEMFVKIGLSGRIETAHDPFYFPKDAIKQQYQLMSSMKYELVAELYQGATFSIASFNNVKDTLCKEFTITDEQDELCHSGCVAFGIDRWVFAILASFGVEPENWPSSLKSELMI